MLINDLYDLYISDGITKQCSDSDWTTFPIWFLLYNQSTKSGRFVHIYILIFFKTKIQT